MTAQQAIDVVRARYPRIKAGHWTADRNGPDWEVRHRYAGRRAATVEIYVCPDGGLEDVDGNRLESL